MSFSNEAYRRIVDAVPEGIWVVDPKGWTIFSNRRMAEILGIDFESMPEQSCFGCVFPDELEDAQRHFARTLAGDRRPFDFRLRRADGSRIWVSISCMPVYDETGSPTGLLGLFSDITERKQAEAALRESEGRLNSAERLAHVGHWHRDLKSDQVTWSEECSRIFGWPREYTLSKEEFLQVVAPKDREMVEREVRKTLAAKRANSMEFRIVRPDGELRTVMSVAEVLMDDEGSPARVFGAVQDVTEVRRAQEQTIARQKLESLGTLANGIAHDFNNLLGGVLAQAELALSELAAGVNPEEELRAIRDVAIRGCEIVRELMIYAGKESVSEALVDVSRIVREMLELLKVSVSKHAVLETDLGEGLPAIPANAAQLRQIVMNLVTNASDAIGDREGVIRVATRSVKAGQKSPGGIADGPAERDYLELEVSDTGCGIPLEAQAKVFDPFYTTKLAGHGLGLAIVDGIVRSLGGAIHLVSEPGKVTTFQIWLPCAETMVAATTGAMSGSAAIPGLSRAAATVLVVEDEAPLRQAVTKLLRKTGFEVFEAADGTAALALVRGNRGKIDAILLDVTIPGASSAEVLAEAAKAQPATKVIVTSAYSQETLAPPMNAFEVSGFIRKPFQLADLLQTIRNALSL